MMYLTVLFKNPDSVNVPSDIDKDTWVTNMQTALSDFETNYKASVTKISEPIKADAEVDYDTFKNKIDGTTITWSDVAMLDLPEAYYLFVDA